MIAGAEKAGTTSLGAYIGCHPRVFCHLSGELKKDQLEFDVFVRGPVSEEEFEDEFIRTFGRGPGSEELVVGKSVGLLHRPEASRRLYEHNPNCRLIVSLRDPVDRAYSSFWYQRYRGAESAETFEQAIEQERVRSERGVSDPERMYLGKGRYIEHLENLAQLFGASQLHVVTLDDIKRRPQHVVDGICEFLGLEQFQLDDVIVENRAKMPRWPWLAQAAQQESLVKEAFRAVVPKPLRRRMWRWLRRLNAVERTPPPMSEHIRTKLEKYFRPYNRRLEEFLGRDLSRWSS